MSALAFVLVVCYLMVTFGVRTAIQLRRTGASGFHGLDHAANMAARLGAIAFTLAIITTIAAPVLAMTAIAPVLIDDAQSARLAVGLPLFLVGSAATFGAQLAMGDAWRIGVNPTERTQLQQHGPFALVRNPIFSAMVVAGLGIVALVPNVAAVAALLLVVVGIEVQVRAVEEPYLLGAHGHAYRRYASTTGRFVPGVGRLRALRGNELIEHGT
ncbi:MAG: methyltransferase family protein [Actinomycetota bacterium]